MRQGRQATPSFIDSQRDAKRDVSRQPAASAPVELDLAALEKVSGGVTVTGPHGGWADAATVDTGPHGGW